MISSPWPHDKPVPESNPARAERPDFTAEATALFFKEHGWKLCSSKADQFTDKFKAMVIDELGNHPLGEYEYINDCACMLDGGWGHNNGCGCECHKVINHYVKQLTEAHLAHVRREKRELLERLSKGHGGGNFRRLIELEKAKLEEVDSE